MNTPETKHTPGPWTFSYTSAAEAKRKSVDEDGNWDGTDGGGATGFIFGPQNSRYDRNTIAFLPHHRDPREDEERGANARLLAAAPELLTMLRRVMDEYLVRDPASGPVCALTLEQARAAIAKATGQA